MFSIASNPFYDLFDFGTVATITALLLGFGHYFPWHEFLSPPEDSEKNGNKPEEVRPLPRIPSYMYGTISIFAPILILFWLKGRHGEIMAISINIVIGGLAVLACYAFDAWRFSRQAARKARAAERDAAEREAQLRKSLIADG